MRKMHAIVGPLVVALAATGLCATTVAGAATTSTLVPSGSVWKYTDDGV